ncbi:aminopeptidase P1, putative, partial [Leishmania donovani]
MNPYVATVAEWERLSKRINLRPVANIVQDMMPPEKNVQRMYVRPVEFCGATCQERRAAILAELEKKDCDLIILSALDEIAWLTNLRGGDV